MGTLYGYSYGCRCIMKKIGKKTTTDQKNIRQQCYEDDTGELFHKYYGRLKNLNTGKWGEVLLEDCDSPLEAAIALKQVKEEKIQTYSQKRELTIDTLIEKADQIAVEHGKRRCGISGDNHIIIRRHIRPYWDGTDSDQKQNFPLGKSMVNFKMSPFKKHLEAKGLAAQTIKHCLLTVGKLLRAGEIRFIMPDVTIDNKKDFKFTNNDIKRMFDIAEKRAGDLPDLLMFFSNTGCRRSELIKLKWSDVNFKQNSITFRETKNGTDHKIPLNDELKTVLRCRKLRTKNTEFVFAGKGGGMRCQSALSRLFSRLKKSSRLPEEAQPIHGLRAMFASRLSDDGVPLATIKELMNHSEIETTMRYVHAGDDTKRKAIDNLGIGLSEVRNGTV